MKWSKEIFNLFINSSIHVSLAVIALCFITSFEFSLSLPVSVYVFVFCGSVVGYNFIKYVHLLNLKNSELRVFQKYIWIISAIFLGIGLYFIMAQSARTLILVSIFAVITLLYTIPIISKKNFRNFAGIKIFLVALVWAGVTVLIPVTEAAIGFTWDHGVTLMQRFIWVLVLTLPFEIRDLEIDSQTLMTIPQKFGLKVTKVLGGVLLLSGLTLEALKDNVNTAYFFSLLLISIITIIALLFTKKRMSYYYTAFWVEGIPILWVWIFLCVHYFIWL